MKSRAGQIGIVGLLVVVAVGLGALNKIRTDRRAKSVAESLNRKDPPNGSIIHEGPGAASTSEPGQVVGEEGSTSNTPASDPKGVASMDWTELRKALLAGDASRVGNMRGKVGPSDAGIIYGLLSEIPAEALDSDRRGITTALAKLLMEIETEESSGYLLALLTQGALLELGPRGTIPWHLGFRKYAPAAPALEIAAFEGIGQATTNDRRNERYDAMGALIHLDPAKYLPLVAQQLRSVPDTNLRCIVIALQTTARRGTVDIAPAVADLQAKFLEVPRENWWYRSLIGEALAQYSHSSKSKSQSVKTWLVSEVKGLLDPSVQAGLDEAGREAYRDLLKSAETGKAAK